MPPWPRSSPRATWPGTDTERREGGDAVLARSVTVQQFARSDALRLVAAGVLMIFVLGGVLAVDALPGPFAGPGIIVGNGVFIALHFGAGFVFGNYAREVIQRVSDPKVLTLIVLIVLAVVGLVALWLRRAPSRPDDTYECWADCSCPACVAVVAMGSAGTPAAG